MLWIMFIVSPVIGLILDFIDSTLLKSANKLQSAMQKYKKRYETPDS